MKILFYDTQSYDRESFDRTKEQFPEIEVEYLKPALLQEPLPWQRATMPCAPS